MARLLDCGLCALALSLPSFGQISTAACSAPTIAQQVRADRSTALSGDDAMHRIAVAIEKDPKLPWTYFELLEIYSNPSSKDAAKVAENLMAFTALCPTTLEAYNFIRFVDDREKLRALTQRFRRAVESQSSSGIGDSYRRLWSAEFRSSDPTAFDALRAQVRKDIERVRQLDLNNTEALRDGYKLIGDSAAASALPPPGASLPKTFNTDLNAWFKSHPYPKADASKEEKDKFNRELRDAAERWVKDWPDSPVARQWRLSSLSKVETTSSAELEAAGDDLLNTLKLHPFNGVLFVPFQTSVADVWNDRDIRLAQCLQLTEEAMDQLDQSEKANPALFKRVAINAASGRFQTLRIQAAVARKLKNFEKSKAALDEMKRHLEEDPPNYSRFEGSYLSESALLCEAQGHKLDALAYYKLLFNQSPPTLKVEEHVRALWKETGGTDEGFKLWSSSEPKKSAVVSEPSPWSEANIPLTSLHASDNDGRAWTIADLKGKTTLLNVWATWCRPCLAELPDLQKLYEQMKGRKDIQVVSISVDENPGIVGPFLKQHSYTFPVILAQGTFVDELAGRVGVPRTWIVDGTGVVRWEQLGYNPADWPQELLQKMTTLK